VDTILIFIASLGTVYFVARRTGRGQFTPADLMIGLFAGFASLGMSEFLSVEGAEWRSGLPLFFACALAFGLEAALPRRSLWR
jgi:hypothetical protein